MQIAAVIIDDFFEDFSDVRARLDNARYADMQSPVDGVVYPNICVEIPPAIAAECKQRLEEALGLKIRKKWLFVRLSPAGVDVPHQAHTDSCMGQFSMMLYLNRPEHCAGGTSLLRHKANGTESDPTTPSELEDWKRDMNTPDAWEPTLLCGMKANRAFVFPAERYHRAEPIGGFGSDARDARVVMTMFFDGEAP